MNKRIDRIVSDRKTEICYIHKKSLCKGTLMVKVNTEVLHIAHVI